MFSGRYEYNINQKGRVFVPAKMRDGLGERFMLSKSSTDTCLVIYTMEKWEAMMTELEQKATATKSVRRKISGNAAEMEIDKQGRIIIPQSLREFAKLVDDVVIIGIGSTAEIWNPEELRICEANDDPEEMKQLLIELGM